MMTKLISKNFYLIGSIIFGILCHVLSYLIFFNHDFLFPMHRIRMTAFTKDLDYSDIFLTLLIPTFFALSLSWYFDQKKMFKTETNKKVILKVFTLFSLCSVTFYLFSMPITNILVMNEFTISMQDYFFYLKHALIPIFLMNLILGLPTSTFLGFVYNEGIKFLLGIRNPPTLSSK